MISSAPLSDIRILAVEQFGAGPWATMQLADLGADVVKVEDPRTGGDVSRGVPPYVTSDSSPYFESFNRNKRSVALDLREAEGRSTFESLVASSDAVFSNLRGDKTQALGLTFADLSRVKRRIVCCSLSGFGQTGPRSDQGAYDHVIQALAGWMSVTGDPDGPPQRSGLPLVDLAGGYIAALSLLAAVHRARREGVGGDCDISLFEGAISMLAYIGTWVASNDYAPTRMKDSAHQTIVPFQAFHAADGWLMVACPKQSLWERLCAAIDRADLLEDARYADFAGRYRNRPELVATLSRTFAERGVDEWLSVLTSSDVPVAPVNDIAAALADPQTIARGAVVAIDHPTLGRVRQPASPLRVSGHLAPLRPGPQFGAHNRDVTDEWCELAPSEPADSRLQPAVAGASGADGYGGPVHLIPDPDPWAAAEPRLRTGDKKTNYPIEEEL